MLAHYQTVHFVQPNLRGSAARDAFYFRIWPRRRGEAFKQDEEKLPVMENAAALLDIWKEFPIFAEG